MASSSNKYAGAFIVTQGEKVIDFYDLNDQRLPNPATFPRPLKGAINDILRRILATATKDNPYHKKAEVDGDFAVWLASRLVAVIRMKAGDIPDVTVFDYFGLDDEARHNRSSFRHNESLKKLFSKSVEDVPSETPLKPKKPKRKTS